MYLQCIYNTCVITCIAAAVYRRATRRTPPHPYTLQLIDDTHLRKQFCISKRILILSAQCGHLGHSHQSTHNIPYPLNIMVRSTSLPRITRSLHGLVHGVKCLITCVVVWLCGTKGECIWFHCGSPKPLHIAKSPINPPTTYPLNIMVRLTRLPRITANLHGLVHSVEC